MTFRTDKCANGIYLEPKGSHETDPFIIKIKLKNEFIQNAIDILPIFSLDNIHRIVERIKLTKYDSGIVYVCGNGGSSATASHFVSDLLSKKIYSLSLNDNVPQITSIANDIDYDEIFATQLKRWNIGYPDILIAISCSGNSRNIIEAVKYTVNKNIPVILFTSNGGGYLGENFIQNLRGQDICIDVPTDNIYLAEGIHSLLLHNIINEL